MGSCPGPPCGDCGSVAIDGLPDPRVPFVFVEAVEWEVGCNADT
jgi:hypothetical protein